MSSCALFLKIFLNMFMLKIRFILNVVNFPLQLNIFCKKEMKKNPISKNVYFPPF